MDLEMLKTLSELKYQKSMSGIADILEKETRLRSKIDRLRQQAFEAQALPADKPHMQNIGADVIWLKWVAKTVRNLNIELAQVLAQKEALLAGQKRALGRKSVAEMIHRASQQKRQREAQAKAMSQVIEGSLAKGNRSNGLGRDVQ